MAKKGKGFFGEFKEFVMRGNVMDMAVGVIIGGAFASIVTALTTDFINPLINSIGGAEIGGRIHLPWTPTGEEGQYLLWGDFLTAVINFLIMALILFIILKSVNKLMSIGKKKEEEKTAAEEVPAKSAEVLLLEEIRDALKDKKTK
jgi:large conductance mechanosensitive channel